MNNIILELQKQIKSHYNNQNTLQLINLIDKQSSTLDESIIKEKQEQLMREIQELR